MIFRMHPLVVFCVVFILQIVKAMKAPVFDLSWVAGSEYTPSSAPGNSLWWWEYDRYEQQVMNELKFAKKRLGINNLRMFLHSMLFDGVSGTDKGNTLHGYMKRFLNIIRNYDMTVGFVFFDDCWNQEGASLTTPCTPIKGHHNRCWFASPQTHERTNVSRFHDYVYDTVSLFAKDDRVAYWEVYNEPDLSSNFSSALRAAGYGWITQALAHANVKVPVLSCWDDSNYTQLSDMHHYDSNFTDWTEQVFLAPEKGALITEGGSRWFQGSDSDYGSPLTVLHWFYHLRSITPSVAAPFKFGMIINWELMVGESNTRWQWGSLDNSPEPVIPWDAFLFPDGTPVSHVEAASIRNWTLGVNEFLAFENFLPNTHLFVGDSFLSLYANQSYFVYHQEESSPHLLLETTIWPNMTNTSKSGDFVSVGGGFLIGSNMAKAKSGFFIGWRSPIADSNGQILLSLEFWLDDEVTVLASFDMAYLNCGLALNGWNMLRVLVEGSLISVYANPMYPESLLTAGIVPRFQYNVGKSLHGDIFLVALGNSTSLSTRFDYVGVLPSSVLEL